MNVVPDGPAKGVLLQAFINNSSIPAKQDLQQAITQTFNQPPDPVAQQIQQLQLENAMLSNEKLKFEMQKLESETVENYSQADVKRRQTDINEFNARATDENDELDRQMANKNE